MFSRQRAVTTRMVRSSSRCFPHIAHAGDGALSLQRTRITQAVSQAIICQDCMRCACGHRFSQRGDGLQLVLICFMTCCGLQIYLTRLANSNFRGLTFDDSIRTRRLNMSVEPNNLSPAAWILAVIMSQSETMLASPPLDMWKPLQLGCHQTFPSGVFQLSETHAVVKGRLIGRDARLVEGALGLLQFQQTRSALAIRHARDAKRGFGFRQSLCGIDLEHLLARLIAMVGFPYLGERL